MSSSPDTASRRLGKYLLQRSLPAEGAGERFLTRAEGSLGSEKEWVLELVRELSEEPASEKHFMESAGLAAQLIHPNILRLADFGQVDGEYFLVTEYVDGPSLRELMDRAEARDQKLPVAVCAQIIAEACHGLAMAHGFGSAAEGTRSGILHTQLRPDTLIVSRQGEVKVDFCFAQAVHPRGPGRRVEGALDYWAPEQFQHVPMDRRVDVYALGGVLFELLTGARPTSVNVSKISSLLDLVLRNKELLRAIIGSREPVVDQWLELPEAMQRILSRALARKPEQRYPDCLALAADLEAFILSAGTPVTAQRIAQLVEDVAPSPKPWTFLPPQGAPPPPARLSEPESPEGVQAMSSARRASDALLEQYLAGELDFTETNRLESILGSSPEDRARLEELRADSAAFLLQHPSRPAVARLFQEDEVLAGRFAALARDHRAVLQSRARRLFRSHEEGDDVVRETFQAYLHSEPSQGELVPASPVLAQLFTQKAMERLRRNSRWSGSFEVLEISGGLDLRVPESEVASAEAEKARVEALQDLAHLTKGESPEVVTIVVLYFAESHSWDEISQTVGVSRFQAFLLLSEFLRRVRDTEATVGKQKKPAG